MSEDKGVVVFHQGEIVITEEQQRTFVAFLSEQNPTPEELMLHYYFCAAKGTHPLDRLIYFTKRSGKYTPITSIDYLRMRADSSREYAGSDDAVFKDGAKKGNKVYPGSATVTVWRLVNGQRCPFTATARWSEYAPANLESPAAFMWKSKPYVMLAKCAEALALRKGFPGQLQGLYISEEFDTSATVPVNYPVDASHTDAEEPATNEQPEVVDETVEGEPEVRMIDWFDGKQKPADELITKKNADAFTQKFVGKGLAFDAEAHLKNHLRKHFHVDYLRELTWEKFGALINHVKNNGDDSRWYPVEPEHKAPSKAGGQVNLDELVKVWTKGGTTSFSALDTASQERINDMLALVDAGAIASDDYTAMVEVLEA